MHSSSKMGKAESGVDGDYKKNRDEKRPKLRATKQRLNEGARRRSINYIRMLLLHVYMCWKRTKHWYLSN